MYVRVVYVASVSMIFPLDSVLSMWYWFCSVDVVLILFCQEQNQYHIDRTESIPHWQNRINTTSTEQNQYHIDRTESIPHRQNRINTTSTGPKQYHIDRTESIPPKWQKDNQWFTKHYIENKDWATNDCAHEINKTRHFLCKYPFQARRLYLCTLELSMLPLFLWY
jgi:hypothetical protein